MKNVIEKMKAELLSQLNEWLGFDIPEEGTDDYSTWKSRQLEIEGIQNFSDVYDYLNTDDESAREFFEGFGIKDYKSQI